MTDYVTIDGSEPRRVGRTLPSGPGWICLIVCNDRNIPAMGISVPLHWWQDPTRSRVYTSGLWIAKASPG